MNRIPSRDESVEREDRRGAPLAARVIPATDLQDPRKVYWLIRNLVEEPTPTIICVTENGKPALGIMSIHWLEHIIQQIDMVYRAECMIKYQEFEGDPEIRWALVREWMRESGVELPILVK